MSHNDGSQQGYLQVSRWNKRYPLTHTSCFPGSCQDLTMTLTVLINEDIADVQVSDDVGLNHSSLFLILLCR